MQNITNIKIEFPDITKVTCVNTECTHNWTHSKEEFGCNLKSIVINQDGKCDDFLSLESRYGK